MKKGFYFILLLIGIFLPSFAFAQETTSTLFLSPSQLQMNTDQRREVKVFFSPSGKSVSLIEGSVEIPTEHLTLRDIIIGGSDIHYWNQFPELKLNRIYFSASIPGGAVKQQVYLFSFFIEANEEINIVQTEIKPREVHYVTYEPVGKNNLAETSSLQVIIRNEVSEDGIRSLIDEVAPYPFDIIRERYDVLGKDEYYLVFSTHDDRSGVSRYELLTSSEFLDINEALLVREDWFIVSSPHKVPRQVNSQHVYIKAIDKAGNEIVSYLPPVQKSAEQKREEQLFALSIMLVVALVIFLVERMYVKRQLINRKKFDQKYSKL